MRGLLGGGPPDDVDPFTPDDDDDEYRPQSARSVNSSLLSRWLVPRAIRRRAISLSIETPQTEYELGSAIPFRVTMKNALPIPITLTTRSPVLWAWTVDGLTEASHVDQYDPPDEDGKLHFDRGERKQFAGEWSGRFRVTEREWEPADPGEYALGAHVNVDGHESGPLADECVVRLVR
ncbi:hypothetical protein ACAH01_02280 [Halomicrobium sp. HM KBTZ05]|uniref:hypothetical protein n=1 Tax=Halomicrobium sp. HM KBTZ05 TaxID=3242663 RepID=UPI003555E0BE